LYQLGSVDTKRLKNWGGAITPYGSTCGAVYKPNTL